jgi:alpha-tubulin suppressor-like RCC1 family protein
MALVRYSSAPPASLKKFPASAPGSASRSRDVLPRHDSPFQDCAPLRTPPPPSTTPLLFSLYDDENDDDLGDALPALIFELCIVPFLAPRDLAALSALTRGYRIIAAKRTKQLSLESEALFAQCVSQFPGGALEVLEFWSKPRTVACGTQHGAQLIDRQVYMWQTNSGRSLVRASADIKPVELCCGFSTTFAKTANGTVYSISLDGAVRHLLDDVLAMAAGDGFGVFATKQGRVWILGAEALAQVDCVKVDGVKVRSAVGAAVAATTTDAQDENAHNLSEILVGRLARGEKIRALAAGAHHIVALTTSHRMLTAGDNTYSQLGRAGPEQVLEPVELGTLVRPLAIAAGERHTVVLFRDGSVRAAGTSSSGELGLANFQDAPRLTTVPLSGPGLAIATGHRHTLVNVGGHSVYSFGLDADAQLGVQSSFWSSSLPRPSTRPFGVFPREIAAGSSFSVFADASSAAKAPTLYACGRLSLCAKAGEGGCLCAAGADPCALARDEQACKGPR